MNPRAMPETTTPPSTPKLTLATIITLVAIVAQGLMTVELFAAGSVPGKILQVIAMVLTAFGAPVLGRAVSSKALPTALLVLVAAGMLLSIGCTKAQLKDAGARAAQSYVDCMQPAVVSTVIELKPTYRELLELATGGDGKVDREALKSAAAGLKTPATRCAFSTVVAEAMRAVQSVASEVQSAPLAVDKEDLAATFELIRAESFAGERYKLEAGTL
jgi:hypothetical protein